jgi:hypothetical protein
VKRFFSRKARQDRKGVLKRFQTEEKERMKKTTILTITILSLTVALTGACSSDTAPNTATVNQMANTVNTAPANNVNAANTAAHDGAKDDDAPAAVKAVFPEAQSFTTQHKDVPAGAIADIEKTTGGKVPDKDHHSYLAFATKDGKRAQIGAATVVKAAGKDMIIIYESKNGMPTVREVRAEGVPAEFLKQFVGKNHDSKIVFGDDIKAAGGVDEITAKEITQAVRIDLLTMEALYGSPHTH